MAYQRLFTSESVTEGHPDKLADQISDAVLDAILKDDPMGRVACETFAITGQIHIAGEITTKTYVDIPKIVRDTIREIGYDRSAVGFDYETCGVSVSVDEQSPDIAMGVDQSLEVKETGKHDPFELTGAGDQGHDVRVRLPRDEAAHAASDHARARSHPHPRGEAEERRHLVPSSRRQIASHRRVRRAQAGARRRRRHLDAARSGHPARPDPPRGHRARSSTR